MTKGEADVIAERLRDEVAALQAERAELVSVLTPTPLYDRKEIRLACEQCAAGYDGIAKIPRNWEGVHRVQSLERSWTLHDPQDGEYWSVDQWYTHLGLCPDCQEPA